MDSFGWYQGKSSEEKQQQEEQEIQMDVGLGRRWTSVHG